MKLAGVIAMGLCRFRGSIVAVGSTREIDVFVEILAGGGDMAISEVEWRLSRPIGLIVVFRLGLWRFRLAVATRLLLRWNFGWSKWR